MGAIAPVIPRFLGSSAVVTILVGVWLAIKVQGTSHLDKFYSDGWGYAITLGFVVSVAALSTGIGSSIVSTKMSEVGKAIGAGPPTPEQGAQMQQYSKLAVNLARTTAVLVLIAIGSMEAARFV